MKYFVRRRRLNWLFLLAAAVLLVGASAHGQDLVEAATDPTIGEKVPSDVQSIYFKGLEYLSRKQKKDGSWPTSSGFGSETAGVSAICTLAFLSAGEDPNFGKYATKIRRGVRHLILAQDRRAGTFKGNTYDFGFALLCLAEAYGAVDDELLWAGYDGKGKRTIGEALELAVRAATLPANRKTLVHRNWYSTGSSASQGITDTSVGGSVLMGLLAARNAGIAVPDHTINKAIEYFEYMTGKDGTVGYMTNPQSSYGNSMARSAITTLCLGIAKRKKSKTYAAARDYIVDHLEKEYDTHIYYGRYYMAQALFQADYEAWQTWNRNIISQTKREQNEDGSVGRSTYGANYSTGISLLVLALNYRILPIYER